MRRQITAFLTILLGAILLAALAPSPPPSGQVGDIPPIFYDSGSLTLSAPSDTASQQQRLTVMVRLPDPALTEAPAGADTFALRQRIDQTQAQLAPHLASLGAQVLFQARIAYNGIAVSLPAGQLTALRSLVGASNVHVIRPKQRPATLAAPAVAEPAAPSRSGAATGRSIRVGVIDSGLDYTHRDFGGLGGYTANNPTTLADGGFAPDKFVGGFDFAGDAYNASDPLNDVPIPDEDPIDCNGQGTRVAGALAGFGVAADGTTYRGPYTPGLDFSGLRVPPGVAPEAQLYAFKIFGCNGSTTLLIQAIEHALDPNQDGDPSDRLVDVLNISLGTPFGGDDDPDAIAVNNAVRAGVVVVASVGDFGDTFYAVNSPASARLAIAVGASTAAGAPVADAASFSSRGPQRGNVALKPDLVAPGIGIVSAAVGTTDAAAPPSSTTAIAAPQVAGVAALLLQLHPGWDPDQIKTALINTATPVQTPAGIPYPPSRVGAGKLNLAGLAALDLLAYDTETVALAYDSPWVAHTQTQTRTLRIENTGDLPHTVTLSATTTVTETGVTVVVPSEPIIVPPGEQVEAPVSITIQPELLDFTPDATTALTQTNLPRYFMAEHGGYVQVNSGIGGVRVRPAHAANFGSVDFYLDDRLLDDSLDSREVQEYVVTTPGLHTLRMLRPGADEDSRPLFTAQVDLLDGRDYTLVLVGRPRELGIVVIDETASAPPPADRALIHYANANRVDEKWDIGPLDVYLDDTLQVSGLAVGMASPYTEVTPGIHEVEFFLHGADPARDRRVAHKTFEVVAGELLLVGSGRHDDDDGEFDDFEQRVFIGRATPRVARSLRAPFQIFPKSASEAQATAAAITLPVATTAFTVELRNTGARNTPLNGSFAGPQTPLASAFELAAASPTTPTLVRAADLQYVGITSNFTLTQDINRTALFFAAATYHPWSTPNEVKFQVWIDSDMDGAADYFLENTSLGAFFGRTNDVFMSPIFNLDANRYESSFAFWGTFQAPIQPTGFDMTPFNTSVMFQAANARTIGLSPGHTRFQYRVETLARDENRFGRVVDRVPATGWLTYDIAQPAILPLNRSTLVLSTRPVFVDVDGGQINGVVNPTALETHPTRRLLILHHHNPPSSQAETVEIAISTRGPLIGPATFSTMIPLVLR